MDTAYTSFASTYDTFMSNVPYEEWAERIDELIKKYNELNIPEGDETLASEAGLLVDLGCGTGVLTRLMADKGYDCIGIDLSEQMLEVAMEHETEKRILYLNQDMRSFELYSTVGNIISVCDSINYLLEDDDLLSCFKCVNNYLYPRGLFIFDFNTDHNYASIGDDTIAENSEEGSFIWENYYDSDSRINEYDLTLYTKDADGRYIRSEETHTQRGYTADEIISLVRQAGLEVITFFDSDTGSEPDEETCRIVVVAREVTKPLPE